MLYFKHYPRSKGAKIALAKEIRAKEMMRAFRRTSINPKKNWLVEHTRIVSEDSDDL